MCEPVFIYFYVCSCAVLVLAGKSDSILCKVGLD